MHSRMPVGYAERLKLAPSFIRVAFIMLDSGHFRHRTWATVRHDARLLDQQTDDIYSSCSRRDP